MGLCRHPGKILVHRKTLALVLALQAAVFHTAIIMPPKPLEFAQQPWNQYANCLGTDPDLFFPERGDSYGVAAAKAVCNDCVVREECLETNLSKTKGVWGGMSEAERRVLRKQRALAKATAISVELPQPTGEQAPELSID